MPAIVFVQSISENVKSSSNKSKAQVGYIL